MVKHFHFSTILLFVSIQIFLIHIFLLSTIPTNRKRQCFSAQYKRTRLKIASPVQGIDEVEKIHQDETDTVPVQGPVQDNNAVEEIHFADQKYNTLNAKVHVPESSHKIGFRFDKKKGKTGNIYFAGIAPGTPADKINNWSETIMYTTVLKYNNEDITCIILCISRQILESKPITFDIEFCIVIKGLISSLCQFIDRRQNSTNIIKISDKNKDRVKYKVESSLCMCCMQFFYYWN